MNDEILALILIFCARVIDVSLGTIRIILVSQGYRKIAPIMGFVEILIWLTAIGKALNNLSSIYSYLIYAGGFATGNYVGMLLESKLSLGFQSVRIITSEKVTALPMALKDEGLELSIVNGKGAKGDILIIYVVAQRRKVKKLINLVNEIEPHAIITVEDVRSHKTSFLGGKKFSEILSRQITKRK
ncbi:MAG: DUF2179 domain-containing protein [Spirochaetes bacterium]|nr:DUF2179 domain-containing protein [Spirochaetota bacterium]